MKKNSLVPFIPVLGVFGAWALFALVNLAFWVGVAYVVIHFIAKFW